MSERRRLASLRPPPDVTVSFSLDAESNNATYHPILTDGRASYQEIVQILNEVRNLQQPFLKENKRRWNRLILFVIILIICAWASQIMVVIKFKSRLLVFLVCVTYTIIITCIAAIVGIRIEKATTDRAKETIQKYFDDINPEFVPRGLRWKVPDKFLEWVELWKEYRTQEQNEAGYMPPDELNDPHEPQNSYALPVS